jgi:hypothetical protein
VITRDFIKVPYKREAGWRLRKTQPVIAGFGEARGSQGVHVASTSWKKKTDFP